MTNELPKQITRRGSIDHIRKVKEREKKGTNKHEETRDEYDRVREDITTRLTESDV